MKKLVSMIALGVALTSCSKDKPKDLVEQHDNIENNSNISKVERYMPEFEEHVAVFYNFNDSTQTIVRDHSSGANYATYAFSRRAMKDLQGTERTELNNIVGQRTLSP